MLFFNKSYLKLKNLPSPPGPSVSRLKFIRIWKKGERTGGYAFHDFLLSLGKKYGSMIRLSHSKLFSDVYYFSDPSQVKRILIDLHSNLIPMTKFGVAGKLFGLGLVPSHGEDHTIERKAIQPEFHRKRIEGYFNDIYHETKKYVNTLKQNQIIELGAELGNLTAHIVARTLFATEIEKEVNSVRNAISYLETKVFKMEFQWGVLKNYLSPKFQINRHRVYALMYRFISERLEKYKQDNVNLSNDLITMLIHIYHSKNFDKSKTKSFKVWLRDHSINFFSAGHETTAKALMWTFYLLCKNPSAYSKMQEEIDSVLNHNRELSLADLEQLSFTKKVFKEALRLFPPIHGNLRVSASEVEVSGYKIPKGSMLMFSTFNIHRDEKFYERPHEFLPDRWTEAFEKSLPRGAYMPFGLGPKICIGEAFANMEALVTLAMITQKFTFELFPIDTVATPKFSFVLASKEVLKFKVRQR